MTKEKVAHRLRGLPGQLLIRLRRHVPVTNGTCCSREPELAEAGHRAAVSSRLSIFASRSLATTSATSFA
jgi:hypothetical protein